MTVSKPTDDQDAARLWPGFAVETMFVPERYSPAVVVTEVHPASAVALAGLKIGDVLVRLNGNAVAAYSQDVERVLGSEESLSLTVESTVALQPTSPVVGAVDGSGDFGGALAEGKATSETGVVSNLKTKQFHQFHLKAKQFVMRTNLNQNEFLPSGVSNNIFFHENRFS
jgi:membrane-associated protease RseP (regulator of RpoE activity)